MEEQVEDERREEEGGGGKVTSQPAYPVPRGVFGCGHHQRSSIDREDHNVMLAPDRLL